MCFRIDQSKFPASFAVEIDEGSVSHLQKAPDRTWGRTAANVTYTLPATTITEQ